MRRTVTVLGALLLFLLAACGKRDDEARTKDAPGKTCEDGRRDHAALTREALRQMKEFTSVLAGVTDEASARAAVPRLKGIVAGFKAMKVEAEKLGPPPKEEDARLGKLYEADFKAAQGDLTKETLRIGEDKKLSEILEGALREFSTMR